MKDLISNKTMKEIIITKRELQKYFDNKKIIKKSEYVEYLKNKNTKKGL